MKLASTKGITTRQLKYEIGQCSDVGLVRSFNEDSLLSFNLGPNKPTDIIIGLYAVADGLGGREGGEVASKMALKVLADNISKFIISTTCQRDLFDQETILRALTAGVRAANNEVFSYGQACGSNMATTLVTALVINETAYIANVGDSRAYCLERGQIRQVTVDHSLVASLVSDGEIGPEDLYSHPQRNIVTRCLGAHLNIEVDLFNEALKPNKSLILCSDGLWEMVRDADIKRIVREQGAAQNACEKLVDIAKRNGGIDNISVVIVKVIG